MECEKCKELLILIARHNALEKLLEERRSGDLKALELQAKEYERRITECNHAISRAEIRDRNFVNNELYNAEKLVTSNDMKLLWRIVSIGLGIALALEFILPFNLFK